jgi:hypothetical protein
MRSVISSSIPVRMNKATVKANRNNIGSHRTHLVRAWLGICVVSFLFTVGFGAAYLTAAAEAGDHLVPVVEYLGSAPLYRKLWQQKLFVTPGDIARYV